MKIQETFKKSSEKKIKRIEITKDTLSSRGGLAMFVRYMESIKILNLIKNTIGSIYKNKKGKAIELVIAQIVAYFVDGSRKSIRGFDEAKEDSSLAAVLEIEQNELLSSDTVKRFFNKFVGVKYFLLRKVLLKLFIWRLSLTKPKVINLYLDTMVLDNDDANTREGVTPTYKQVKGFQPLQLSWMSFIVDAIFRSGKMHSNHGNDVQKMLKKVVTLIREEYSKDVPIIIRCDSGFMSESNFKLFEKELKVHYICSGKLYKSITGYANNLGKENFKKFEGNKNLWSYTEFGSKLDVWDNYRKTIYTTPHAEANGQLFLSFARPENVLYTNIGTIESLDEKLMESGYGSYLETENIIKLYHQNGESELVHRSFKEFALSEKLPFKHFHANAAYYYLMVIAHLLFQSYKEDVCSEIINIRSYPETARRKLIDFSAKIVKTAHTVILKVTEGIAKSIQIQTLWEKCNNPIPIAV